MGEITSVYFQIGGQGNRARHIISTARKVKGGGQHLFHQIEPN